jgi:Zn-dependent M28 family amino/carboxypeptidase
MTSSYRVTVIACASVLALAAAPAPQDGATTPADVRRILSALADDSMQGRATGTPGAQRAARYIGVQMRQIGLEPLGDSGFFQRVAVTLGPAVNVLGVIRGSDPALKNEYVLVDAHYDHLGIGRPVNGDSIYNGADDDASGVTAVLEIARQVHNGPKPKRTVVFAAMIGEEVGLLGTNWYIAHPAIPLTQMAANLEIEMIGRPDSLAGGVGKAWLTGYERSTMGDELAANGIPIVPDKRPDEHFFERSDNIAFAMRGIPAHTLSSFNLHADYHRPSDEISKVDFVHMAGVINAGARAVRLLTDGPKPEWKPGGRP